MADIKTFREAECFFITHHEFGHIAQLIFLPHGITDHIDNPLRIGFERSADRTYKVFLETWHELSTAQTDDLQWWCQGRWDRSTGLDLPEDQVIGTDPDKTIRSWMAVMAYLMMDYQFMYE